MVLDLVPGDSNNKCSVIDTINDDDDIYALLKFENKCIKVEMMIAKIILIIKLKWF